MVQDSFAMDPGFNAFLGLEVPYFFFAVKPDEAHNSSGTYGMFLSKRDD